VRTTRPAGLRLVLRFPTTFVISVPHVLVFLPLAIWNDNPGTDFIVQMWAIAVAGTFIVEASVAVVTASERRSGRATAPASRPDPSTLWVPERVAAVARTVAAIAIVANLTSALLGAGTLRSQVDAILPSGAASILTPFTSWAQVALALLVVARFLGGLGQAAVIRWIGALLIAQVAEAAILTITAGAASFLILSVVLAYLTNLVPRTWLASAIGVLAVLWPTVYAIRNQLRAADGIDVDADVSASDRLRFDEQIARAAQYGPGHDLGQPGLSEMLRYGLVPRFLDPGRAGVSSGNLINEYLGGVDFSAYTFLPVATAWFFWGTLTVVLLYAACSAIVMALRPWHAITRRPYALVLLTLMLGGPLAWFSTPPDTTIALLQTVVTVLPVFLVLHLWARRSGPSIRRTVSAPATRRSSATAQS
jgi:hypothetical protein